ncbi:hypothetical protein POTOM_043652 [Populus tomentosa]|uniref:non-specific serine/threonine protein kinase n=1 Tax=Populus tomentosa TaxID=118781 RepID=A0A8X8CFN9_POPTO|nr:hypothetical protein POTOM_043652 [Populus tomentosa]
MPPLEPMNGDDLNIVDLITPEKPVLKTNSKPHSVQSRIKSYLPGKDVLERNSLDEGCEEIEGAAKKLSSASMSTLSDHDMNIVDLITPEKPVLKTNSKPHSVQSRIKSYLPSKDVLKRNSPTQKRSSILVCDEGCEDIEGAVKKLSLASTSALSDHDLNIVDLITPENPDVKTNSKMHSVQSRINSYLQSIDVLERNSLSQKSSSMLVCDEGCEGIEGAIKKLSLASTSNLSDHDYGDPFAALLAVCGQSVPLTLLEVFSKYCEPDNIVKVGEGTYGEAFEAGNTVCKIVPIDGDLPVNGEVQKRSEELLEEVILSRTLNNIRSHDSEVDNACTTFIEILDLGVCEGPYDLALVRAWEYWDERHGSENDHPKEFPEKQCYVVFVLQHGGKDLESFVLSNFDEVHSLLVQVTAGLAIAEAAYEFEHRDLHWGNILLRRNDSTTTLIYTGQDILFPDLTLDPYLFKGPKGDRQARATIQAAETYRKMKKVTGDFWEGSFPKTNVLWLIYLVDILLLKKSFDRSSKNEGDLHSLKKRLSKYNSAKEAIILDPFFSNLLVL